MTVSLTTAFSLEKGCLIVPMRLVCATTDVEQEVVVFTTMQRLDPWHGKCRLQFSVNDEGKTRHQGGCSAPFKLMRSESGGDGRCELPLLHTAGGLVGGDRLSVELELQKSSRCLMTSVAAQKIYGSIDRSQIHPNGTWAKQNITATLAEDSDLEWLPQENVLYSNSLFQQCMTVTMPESASFISGEIVRFGRTAAKETLNSGCWRSSITVLRTGKDKKRWEVVDRLEMRKEQLESRHGLDGAAVLGTLIWAAPGNLSTSEMTRVVEGSRNDRENLSGMMHCSTLDQGLIARYSGNSSRDARFWFSRIWARTRQQRKLNKPIIPRVWPLQEFPLSG